MLAGAGNCRCPLPGSRHGEAGGHRDRLRGSRHGGAFWLAALDYAQQPPPEGYPSWQAYDAAVGGPGDEAGFKIVDPDGVGPTVFFQPVPEPKTAKNRVHLDIRVGGAAAGVPFAQRVERIEAGVAPLVALGATMLRRNDDPDDYFIVLTDPEGNEFCLV